MERGRAEEMMRELGRGWELNAEGHLERTYSFRNFVQAMDFANKVTEVAESENHHPDFHVSWGQCTVEIWTHKIGGLTESDFYFAAKADRAYEKGQTS
jgi:4a-hydroxytetrahydrobiopterin dehydratase